MDPKFISTDESLEFYTEERCHIIEYINDINDRDQSLARARVEVGVTTAWHLLRDTVEIYYVLQGKGLLDLGEETSQEITKDDVVKIPANMPQRITNTGTEDLVFLCICAPAFGPDSYEDLE